MFVGSSERSMGQTTLLLEIDFEVVVPVSYGCSTFRDERGLTVWFLLEFGRIQNTSFQKESIWEITRAVLGAACLKKLASYRTKCCPSLPPHNKKLFYGRVNQGMLFVWSQSGH